jgi:hypothetical protein
MTYGAFIKRNCSKSILSFLSYCLEKEESTIKKRLHRNFNALFSHKDKAQSPKKDSTIKPNSKPKSKPSLLLLDLYVAKDHPTN